VETEENIFYKVDSDAIAAARQHYRRFLDGIVNVAFSDMETQP